MTNNKHALYGELRKKVADFHANNYGDLFAVAMTETAFLALRDYRYAQGEPIKVVNGTGKKWEVPGVDLSIKNLIVQKDKNHFLFGETLIVIWNGEEGFKCLDYHSLLNLASSVAQANEWLDIARNRKQVSEK